MVKTRVNQGWPRRGFALLWDAEVLAGLVAPEDVVSLRQFFSKVDQWSDEDLTAADGNALVVAGVEGCLDVLSADDAARWIETDLKEAVLSFQDFSQGDGGLILWMPSGRNRISMKGASEAYYWKHRDSGKEGLPIRPPAVLRGRERGRAPAEHRRPPRRLRRQALGRAAPPANQLMGEE